MSPVWYLVALSLLAFLAFAALAAHSVDFEAFGRFSGLPAVGAPIMLLLLVIAGFAEEIGWRGFALAQLLRAHSLLTASLVVGVLWAAWHLPLFVVIDNYRRLGPNVLPMFFLGIVCGSIFLAWLYRATHSMLLCATWHGTYNLVYGTAAAQGTVAAVVSVAVMSWAALIVAFELRAWWLSRQAAPTGALRV